MRKIEYSPAETKEKEEKQKKGEEQAEAILDEVLNVSLNIQAQELTAKMLGLSKPVVKKQEPIPLSSPYQDWKISFLSRPDQLGSFELTCNTSELRRELTFNYSETNIVPLIKILIEQPEVGRFSGAIKEGIKKIESEFNDIFEQNIKSFSEKETPEQITNTVRLLSTENGKSLFKDLALQEIKEFTKGRKDLLPPFLARWEKRIFGKPVAEEILETADKGLKR